MHYKIFSLAIVPCESRSGTRHIPNLLTHIATSEQCSKTLKHHSASSLMIAISNCPQEKADHSMTIDRICTRFFKPSSSLWPIYAVENEPAAHYGSYIQNSEATQML